MKIENRNWHALIYFCRLAIQKSNQNTSLRLEGINWDSLIRIAKRHKVCSLLFKGINKWTHKKEVPVAIFNKLKAINFRIIQHNLANTKELISLIKLFDANNIEVLPMKGIILSQQAYNDLGARQFIDIDLMIHEKDYFKAKALLLEEKYESRTFPSILEEPYLKYRNEHSFFKINHGKRNSPIDLHWLFGNRTDQVNFSLEDFQSIVVTQNNFGINMKTFSPEGLLLATCLHHGGKDRWRILQHSCDMAAIITKYKKELDWSLILEVAEKLKTSRILYVGLGLIAAQFSITYPAIIQEKINLINIQKNINRHLQIMPNSTQATLIKKNVVKHFFEPLSYHFFLRRYWSTKLKILYYHIIELFLPNLNDIEGKEISKIEYRLLFIKKPFRLFKKNILSKESDSLMHKHEFLNG